MATDDAVAGVLARLLINFPTSQDEHTTPQLHELWMEHLGDAHDGDVVAACIAILADPDARFPTVGQFLDEVQIQSLDRIRRSIPPDVGTQGCPMCGGVGFVFVEADTPWTVRPCECNERQHQLWLAKHYRPNHACQECWAPLARKGSKSGGKRRHTEPAKVDAGFANRMLGDF